MQEDELRTLLRELEDENRALGEEMRSWRYSSNAMDWGQCKTCGLHSNPKAHQCPPAWDVQVSGYLSDDIPEVIRIYADRSELAAREFVARVDNGGLYLDEDTLITVIVQSVDHPKDPATIWEVSARVEYVYTPRPRGAITQQENKT